MMANWAEPELLDCQLAQAVAGPHTHTKVPWVVEGDVGHAERCPAAGPTQPRHPGRSATACVIQGGGVRGHTARVYPP